MTRLDILVSNQMGYSREMAKELIKSGFVAVGGRIINRPGAKISEDMEIIVNSPDEIFVSRGGYKLRHGLKAFDISVSGLVCLDIGAAAGGFTDCLLRRGAVRVIAVDNGRGQLAARLCADPRVVSLENTDIRNLHLDEAPDFAVCDVSFIPLARVIPAISDLLTPGGGAIFLIKPQFEAGPGHINRRGIVTKMSTHCQVIAQVMENLVSNGLSPQNLDFSPITGGGGNIEYLVYTIKSATHARLFDIDSIVKKAFSELR